MYTCNAMINLRGHNVHQFSLELHVTLATGAEKIRTIIEQENKELKKLFRTNSNESSLKGRVD